VETRISGVGLTISVTMQITRGQIGDDKEKKQEQGGEEKIRENRLVKGRNPRRDPSGKKSDTSSRGGS